MHAKFFSIPQSVQVKRKKKANDLSNSGLDRRKDKYFVASFPKAYGVQVQMCTIVISLLVSDELLPHFSRIELKSNGGYSGIRRILDATIDEYDRTRSYAQKHIGGFVTRKDAYPNALRFG